MNASETTVLITGSNRGIGKAFVQAYLAHGAKKVYATARKREDLDAIVALDPARVVPLVVEVTNPDQIAAAAAVATDVNVVINNAGVLQGADLLKDDLDAARRELEVNYFGPINVTRAFAPILEKNGGGVLVNLLSVVSFVTFPGYGGYSASKAAAWSITQRFRADLAAKKIRVVGVYPGPIDTDMAREFPMDKASPNDLAVDVIRGIAAGEDDIFPDAFAKQAYAAWAADHKAVEKQYSGS